MLVLKLNIVKYISDDQPGFVEASFKDAWDKEIILFDKVPIFTETYLDADSIYPQPGVVACMLVKKFIDPKGRNIVTITTEKPWAVDSIDGEYEFDVLPEQLIERNP